MGTDILKAIAPLGVALILPASLSAQSGYYSGGEGLSPTALRLDSCPGSLREAVRRLPGARYETSERLSDVLITHYRVPSGSTYFGQPVSALSLETGDDEEFGEYDEISLNVTGSFAALRGAMSRRYAQTFCNGTYYCSFQGDDYYSIHLQQKEGHIEVRCTNGD